jgi:membrane-bound metal-dependent hydrolase YbcI (DUF457 family)
MPGYRGHSVGGLLVFGALRYALNGLNPTLLTSFEWLACALLGALFPDIDIKSRGQNLFYLALAVGYGLALMAGKLAWSPFFVAAALFPMLMRHRGLSHNLWFAVAISVSTGLGLSIVFPAHAQAAWFDALFFGAGIFSHLALDRWFSK